MTLHVVGPKTGGPSLDDVRALYRALTGQEPTEADIEEARQTLAESDDHTV